MPVLAHQVIGRHLEPVPGRRADQIFDDGLVQAALDGDPAGQDEPRVRPFLVRQLLHRPADELVHIAVVVGEQDPGLGAAPVAAGIMHEAAQGIIDPRRVEERQGPRLVLLEHPGAVGDLVADLGEKRRREMLGEFRCGMGAAAELVAPFEHVRIRDLLVADADRHGRPVIAHQVIQLLEQIGPIEGRLGDGRRIGPWPLELGIGPLLHRRQGGRAIIETQFRIAEAGSFEGRRSGAGGEEMLERLALRLDGAVMERDEPLDGFLGCGDGLEGGDLIGWHVDSLLLSRASRVIHCFDEEPNRVERIQLLRARQEKRRKVPAPFPPFL